MKAEELVSEMKDWMVEVTVDGDMAAWKMEILDMAKLFLRAPEKVEKWNRDNRADCQRHKGGKGMKQEIINITIETENGSECGGGCAYLYEDHDHGPDVTGHCRLYPDGIDVLYGPGELVPGDSAKWRRCKECIEATLGTKNESPIGDKQIETDKTDDKNLSELYTSRKIKSEWDKSQTVLIAIRERDEARRERGKSLDRARYFRGEFEKSYKTNDQSNITALGGCRMADHYELAIDAIRAKHCAELQELYDNLKREEKEWLNNVPNYEPGFAYTKADTLRIVSKRISDMIKKMCDMLCEV